MTLPPSTPPVVPPPGSPPPVTSPQVSLPPTASRAPLVEPAASLSAVEIRRYSRHLSLPDVGMTGQRRLRNAKVLVIGAGGLGSPVLLYLAAAGVGVIGVVDFDRVDTSNLQRQVIHGEDDLGRPKVESARDAIARINPLVVVQVHDLKLDSSNARALFAGFDLVVDGTDNFDTRYVANDAAVALGIPYVWASLYRFDGQVSVFWPAAPGGTTPCFRCLFPQPPPPGTVPSCAEGGVLGVLCATLGSIQATEAVKLITGIGAPLLGEVVVYDALAMAFGKLPVRRDPDCLTCGPAAPGRAGKADVASAVSLPPAVPPAVNAAVPVASSTAPSAISVTTLKQMLDERTAGSRDFLLVDIREPYERQINHIPGSVLVPQRELLDPRVMRRLPADRPVVLYCRSGVRSASALTALRTAGFADSTHVDGGVLAWVEQIDHSQPSY